MEPSAQSGEHHVHQERDNRGMREFCRHQCLCGRCRSPGAPGVRLADEKRFPLTALIDRVVAAVKSDTALPADPEGQAALRASLLKAATEQATPVGTAPELVEAVSRKTWRFSDNELLVRAIRLNLAGITPTFELTIYAKADG